MIFWMSETAMGSMRANGSSRRMNWGDMTSARVISVRRRSPPESVYTGDAASGVKFNSASSSPRRLLRVEASRSSVSRMATMFCPTVSPRKIEGSCGR